MQLQLRPGWLVPREVEKSERSLQQAPTARSIVVCPGQELARSGAPEL